MVPFGIATTVVTPENGASCAWVNRACRVPTTRARSQGRLTCSGPAKQVTRVMEGARIVMMAWSIGTSHWWPMASQ